MVCNVKRVRLYFLLLLCISGFLYFGYKAVFNNSVLKYVDLFIGTENGGHTFVGATVPFGMVKLGPDYGERQSNSGYYEPFHMQRTNNPNVKHDSVLREIYNNRIQGFSHTHVSGTGGGPKYGNILVKPCVGDINTLINDYSSFRHEKSEIARPGYYSVKLGEKKNIKVELTSTNKVGFHKYTFNKTDSAYIIFDPLSFLGKYHCCSENQELVSYEINIDPENNAIYGFSSVKGGWNKGETYTVYFYAVTKQQPDSFGYWKDSTVYNGNETIDTPDGAFFHYKLLKSKSIDIKVGISFTSIDYAKSYFLNNVYTFNEAYTKAKLIWESYLSKIEIETFSNKLKTIFYTALYHSFLMPTDRSFENPWNTNNPYYDDYYAIWDTYRTLHPLFTLIVPDKQIEMIQSLIEIYEKEGYMPDARSGNCNGRTQGGTNSDILISEAYLKKLGLDKINYQKAFEAMIKNAEKIPIPKDKNLSRGDSIFLTQKEGRYINPFYREKGYFSADYIKVDSNEYILKVERPATRTLEYSFCDWAIANIADVVIIDSIKNYFPADFDFSNLKDYYLERSENWMNLWNFEFECDGIKGFIAPKNSEGEWMDSIPDKGNILKDYNCELNGTWTGFFYESNAWENSFFVPHDIKGLIDICGGVNSFENRLDIFFNENYFNVKNEPSFLTPCLYVYINKRDKSISRIHSILNKYYNTTRGGIPGNDDSGAMSSWYIFNSIGLYPNAGDTTYLITAPIFRSVTINLPNGKKFIIKKENNKKYKGNIILNNIEYNDFFISHQNIISGGVLEIYQ